jgi:hypothetical protein
VKINPDGNPIDSFGRLPADWPRRRSVQVLIDAGYPASSGSAAKSGRVRPVCPSSPALLKGVKWVSRRA